MSRKKKGLALWLALFLGVSSLTGCGSGNDTAFPKGSRYHEQFR